MSNDTKDPKSPATTSEAYDRMAPRWALMEALLGGTETMRAAGKTYLPSHAAESEEDWAVRLSYTTLLNMTGETLDQLASKPFTEAVKVNEDVPAAIAERIFADVDLQGNELGVFLHNWFRTGLAKAFAHVLVEMPRLTPPKAGVPRTLDDDRREGVRPYWVAVRPENVIAACAEIQNGREVLTHVRIKECVTVQDGFAEVVKVQIRVLEPGRVEIWEPKPRTNTTQKEEWVKMDEWATALPYIPFRTFYAERSGLMEGKSPLLDLAYQNVYHWQASSDQKHSMKVARYPMLACSGASKDDSDPITVGPTKILYNDDAQGKFYYVEHTGAAIAAGASELETLERQMAGYGAEFLKEEPGATPTATGEAINSAEETSYLKSVVVRFEDAVADAIAMTADCMKVVRNADDYAGTIELVKDFGDNLLDVPRLNVLQAARTARDISRQAFLSGLITAGVLPEDFDPEADGEALEEEAAAAMAMGAELDPAPEPPEPKPGAGA